MKKGMERLLGVVLCGGESRRMGRDKGLLPKDGKTWVQLMTDKLEALEIPVVISINQEQQETYGRLFSKDQLVVDNLDIDGPLLGILSVHQQYPDKDILPLACDMIDMNTPTLQELIDVYLQNNDADFIAFYHDGFLETLGAVYKAAGLAPLLEKAKNNDLKYYSLIRKLEEGNTLRLPLHSRAAFHNYNSRNEIIFPEEDIK